MLLEVLLVGFVKDTSFWRKKIFLIQNSLRNAPVITFTMFLISSDKYVNENKFSFVYKFKTLFYRINSILLSCFDCQDLAVNSTNSHIQCFLRYFPEKQSN